MNKPVVQKEINIQPLKSICQEYIDFVASEEHHEDNDFKNHIFEKAMITIYGENVFDWINSRIR